jgi:prolipoprotein diacylglyceryl transferase
MFQLGSFGIRWYSMCWLVGLFLGYLLMQRLYKQQQIPEEKFEPLFLYIFISVLVGARLGHCLFYQPDYFLSSWDHIVEMFIPMHHMPDGSWKFTGYEGLASHGGVIGMIIAILLFRATEAECLDRIRQLRLSIVRHRHLYPLGQPHELGDYRKVTDVPGPSSSSVWTSIRATPPAL